MSAAREHLKRTVQDERLTPRTDAEFDNATGAYLTPYSSLPEWMDESVPSMTVEERTEWITHEKTPVTDH